LVARVGRGALLPGQGVGQEARWMTLPAMLPSTMPASLDLPLLPMTGAHRGRRVGNRAPLMAFGRLHYLATGPATLCCQSAHQAASSGGGAWRRQVKSGVILLVAGCLSGWPASASYSQP
jgi:hypothetical protein